MRPAALVGGFIATCGVGAVAWWKLSEQKYLAHLLAVANGQIAADNATIGQDNQTINNDNGTINADEATAAADAAQIQSITSQISGSQAAEQVAAKEDAVKAAQVKKAGSAGAAVGKVIGSIVKFFTGI